ncbi:MAG: integrating conjugative element protein [Candidatus Competibacteraceae bacterium]|nr:integrating conjugative element protein [Candidatus Competibacteraceae bacterium]
MNRSISGWVLASVLTLGGTAGGQALAQTGQDDSVFYYRIGGATPINASIRGGGIVSSAPVGFSTGFSMGNSCGGFDPVLSLTHTFNNLGDVFEGYVADITYAFNAAIASLPTLILQRANPGLYDLLQNTTLSIKERINLATKSCEQMISESAAGQNPFEEWINLSVGQDWKASAGVGGLNILTAKADIEEDAGSDGVRWVGGRRGGKGQEPIRIVRDTVRAGFNTSMGYPVASSASLPPTSTAPIAQFWTSAHAAAAWAVDVFGDLEVRTCEEGSSGCPATTGKPGGGLTPKQETELTSVRSDLQSLLNGTTSPTPVELAKLSAPGVEIGWELIQALEAMSPAARGVAAGRLAGEIATARTVEKALYIRRLVLAGRQTPDVAGARPAQEILDRKLVEIDREIENLLFENRVRRELVSETASAIFGSALDSITRTGGTGPGGSSTQPMIDSSTPGP